MAEDFTYHQDSLLAPARVPFSVTPHDSSALPIVPKRLYVGTGGHVTLRGVGASSDVVYRNVASGVYLNVRASHIRATGTTAADIVGEA
jgi:hypothetical protein